MNCDEPGLNSGWATANHSERLRIAAAHKSYLLGSLYYMANDPRVPNYTRYAIGRWGLCADEYVDFGNWPPQLYIRISNRLRGEVLLTQNTLANPRSKPDGVSMGCWEFDQHTESRHAVADPHNASQVVARNEGYFRNDLSSPHLPCSDPRADCSAAGNWYDVPFGVMLPKRGQVRSIGSVVFVGACPLRPCGRLQASNLLVPVAISSTSVAYSSTRIEGMFMDLGTAAGVAAALALESTKAARETRSLGEPLGVSGGTCLATPLQDTNVTLVQDVLVNVYKQRVHGPIAPADGPGPSGSVAPDRARCS